MQATTVVSAPSVENIPERLTERPQWVMWKLEKRDGKPTKVPHIAGGVGRASSTDLLTWRTFEEAVQALEGGRYDGIGFCSADPFCGIDLDDCRDPESGEISPWAEEIISSVQEGYVEISPSGTGIHVIVEGTVRGGGMRKGKVEMYGRDRFFTVTGRIL